MKKTICALLLASSALQGCANLEWLKNFGAKDELAYTPYAQVSDYQLGGLEREVHSVRASGGATAESKCVDAVTSQRFADLLQRSLRNHGAMGFGGDYRIEGRLLALDSEVSKGDVLVTKAHYKLVHRKNGSVLLDKEITTKFDTSSLFMPLDKDGGAQIPAESVLEENFHMMLVALEKLEVPKSED